MRYEHQVESLSSLHIEPKTIFVFSIGFEARSLSIIDAIGPSKFEKLISFSPVNNKEHSEEHQARIVKIAEDKIHCYETWLEDPLKSTDSILSGFSSSLANLPRPNLLFDITTFTKEILLIILKIIEVNRENFGKITFCYSPAAQLNSDWLSEGVASIRPILGYSGELLPSLPTHLIILAGLELNRLKEVILDYEPESISIGVSRIQDDDTKKYHDDHQSYYEQLRETYSGRVHFFSFSVTDPLQTSADIAIHLSDFVNSENQVIAPMSNKISTLGAGLYALQKPSVQLCYAQAINYNIEGYSTPSRSALFFDIDL